MSADLLELLVSLVVLTVAGDQFVVGVARVAASLRVRPTVVGAIIGGIGTSLPELIVAWVASARGDTQLAVGNLVGSVIANISLGLAIAALVAPVRVDSRTVRREAPLSVASVLLFALVVIGGISAGEGLLLVVVLGASLFGLLMNARRGPMSDELAVEVVDFFGRPTRQRVKREIARTVAGMVGMVAGAELLVASATDLAQRLGLAEGFVGLTLVAVGTSAPLIAASVQAARRGDHDLVVGNVLGGNLVIALAGGAIVAFVANGPSGWVGPAPLWSMSAVTVAAWGFMARGSRITRWEAVVLLLAYGATLPFVAR